MCPTSKSVLLFRKASSYNRNGLEFAELLRARNEARNFTCTELIAFSTTYLATRRSTEFHFPMLAPFRRKHNEMRPAIEGMSFSLPSYFLEMSRMRRLKIVSVSLPRSVLRKVFSVLAHTFSWGFKSGECAGQDGSKRTPQSCMAFLASGVCMILSPSSKRV
jgi:hypothetical protein